VLLVWGDATGSPTSAEPRLLDAVRPRLVVLDDCGHCPQVEFPTVVAQLLTALPGSAISQLPMILSVRPHLTNHHPAEQK
jgi:hypothetical protein